MEWYKSLGFECEYYPPGFAILRRDEIEIFLQQQPGYVAPDDPGRRERDAWNVYIMTDNVKALYEEYSALPGLKIASAFSSGLRDDGVRRDGFERTPTGVRTADVGKVIRGEDASQEILVKVITRLKSVIRA